MPIGKVGAKQYYDYLPPSSPSCGDIWTGLPSQGLLGTEPISGIVITPACDISQRKVETITYLPILPVRSYFSTVAFLPDIRRRISNSLKAARFKSEILWPANQYHVPPPDVLASLTGAVEEFTSAKQHGKAEHEALARAQAGLRIAAFIATGRIANVPAEDLVMLFGKEWSAIKERLVRNALSTDLHFLPSDDQGPGMPGIPQPALVLFRYPITASVVVFDLAQETPEGIWSATMSNLAAQVPSANMFAQHRPLKVLSLRPTFLSDLLTRFIGLYGRVGSPDFSSSTINAYCEAVDN